MQWKWAVLVSYVLGAKYWVIYGKWLCRLKGTELLAQTGHRLSKGPKNNGEILDR